MMQENNLIYKNLYEYLIEKIVTTQRFLDLPSREMARHATEAYSLHCYSKTRLLVINIS